MEVPVVGLATPSTISNNGTTLAKLQGVARLLTAYLVLPNVPFILAAQFVFLGRATINVDYLLLGCVAPFLSRRTVRIAFAVLLAIDCVISCAPVFHFDLGTGAIPIVGALTSRLLFYPVTLALLLTIALVAAIAERLSRVPAHRADQTTLIVATVLTIFADVVAGTNSVQKTDGGVLGFNIGTSTLYLGGTVLLRNLTRSGPPTDIVPITSATGALRRDILSGSSGQPPAPINIVLVIVESLGHFRTDGSDSTLFAPLLTPAIRTRYAVQLGSVPAHGATTSGELRELCGLRGDFLAVRYIKTEECLPAALARQGYATAAFHGYSRALYGRMTWYPEVGFKSMSFAEDFSQVPNTKLCGTTFHGVCDQDVARLVEAQLLHRGNQQRQFLYWLTLDSHLPVDMTNIPSSDYSCEGFPGADRFNDVCNLLRLYERVFNTIATWANSPDLPPTRFIIVGDHAPPFFSRQKRSLFAADEVPFLELTPRKSLLSHTTVRLPSAER